MDCQHCGADIREDSLFCFRCGRAVETIRVKSTGARRKSVLHTPYPYTALLLIGFVFWASRPERPAIDYSMLRMELELRGESGYPAEDIHRHHLSLVVENIGTEILSEVPIEIRARLEPQQPVKIVSDFLGRQMTILDDRGEIPLVVILSDEVDIGKKRRYAIDGIVVTRAPAEVTYEILSEGQGEILAFLDATIPSSQRSKPSKGPIAFNVP